LIGSNRQNINRHSYDYSPNGASRIRRRLKIKAGIADDAGLNAAIYIGGANTLQNSYKIMK